jgi:hypothetical protein
LLKCEVSKSKTKGEGGVAGTNEQMTRGDGEGSVEQVEEKGSEWASVERDDGCEQVDGTVWGL